MTYQNTTYCPNLCLACSPNAIFGDTQSAENEQKLRLDYYVFGMPMHSRTFTGNGYKFGFNGQEKEDDIYGEGNTYSAEYWMYDSRLGRRWNVDPVDQISISNYAVLSNSPVCMVDPLGDTDYYNKRGKYLGTDGDDNNLIGVVSNRKLLRQIKKDVRKHGIIYTVNDNAEFNNVDIGNGTKFFGTFFVDRDVLNSANDVLTEAINEPMIREYMRIMQTKDGGGAETVFSDIGSEYTSGSRAEVDFPSGVIGDVTIHSHPIKQWLEGSTVRYFDALEPTKDDGTGKGDLPIFQNYDMNIIVGENGVGGGTLSEKETLIPNARPRAINFFDKKGNHTETINRKTANKILKQ
ncbi:MAG: hypothetical protein ACOCWG_04850 [bacterium]